MNASLAFDADLLRRFGLHGPRYTSYPPATEFNGEFDVASFRAHALLSNAIPKPLSLYVHVPYCFSPCFYCGCNRVITRDVTKGVDYVRRVMREIELVAQYLPNREVIQLHLGGGTPNFLEIENVSSMLAYARRQFRFSTADDRDFSIELDPRYIADGSLAAYVDLGLNRASLGVQDFDADVQQAVNRVQSVSDTLRVIDSCRAAGFRSINVDLIYGLPRQTLEGFAKTLAIVIAARPERLAIYGYAHMPKMFKAQRQIDSDELPNAELKLALLQLATEKLGAAGYRHIGMDHFAIADDELARAQTARTLHRNFMGYTTHANTDLLGVGVSAISHLGHSYSQNPRDLRAWEIAIDQGKLPVWRGKTLDSDDRVRAAVIQQWMCNGEIDVEQIEREFVLDFSDYFADELDRVRSLAKDGLVVIDAARIRATPRGRLLLRIAAMCFDRYLRQSEPQSGSDAPRFSAAI